MADQGIEESGPWVGRSVAPGAGKGNPTSQGWPMTRRPRQRGPDSIISDEIGGRRMEIKMTEIAATTCRGLTVKGTVRSSGKSDADVGADRYFSSISTSSTASERHSYCG